MEPNKLITIEVSYAGPDKQKIVSVKVPENSTIEKAIELSGILKIFPEINLAKQAVGIFSQQKKLKDIVHEGDRIEIYRALSIDPKTARKKRAES